MEQCEEGRGVWRKSGECPQADNSFKHVSVQPTFWPRNCWNEVGKRRNGRRNRSHEISMQRTCDKRSLLQAILIPTRYHNLKKHSQCRGQQCSHYNLQTYLPLANHLQSFSLLDLYVIYVSRVRSKWFFTGLDFLRFFKFVLPFSASLEFLNTGKSLF